MLSLIRLLISGVAREMGYTEDMIGEIEMCVDEACANVIDHAYATRDNADPSTATTAVGIELNLRPEGLTISIVDNGVGPRGNFRSSVTNLEEYCQRERPRGLGLYIINKLMDNVSLEFPNGRGTRLTMTKLLPTESR